MLRGSPNNNRLSTNPPHSQQQHVNAVRVHQLQFFRPREDGEITILRGDEGQGCRAGRARTGRRPGGGCRRSGRGVGGWP
ncbi:MAG: hypothetical protein WKG07_05485 [Hymenobacter sp.]